MTTIITHRIAESTLRRWLMIAATVATVFGMLHHIDHILRGSVGWPLSSSINPFTYSLAIYLFVLPGLYLTYAGRIWAGYWLAVALASLALVIPVHFGPVPDDSVAHIHMAYAQPGFFLAMAVLFGLVGSLIMLAVTAIRVRMLSKRW